MYLGMYVVESMYEMVGMYVYVRKVTFKVL